MTQSVAQAWLVLQLTGSALDLGVLGALTCAPVLVGSAWAGSLADRADRRRLLMVTQALFIGVGGIQAALVATGHIQLWLIYVLAIVGGAILTVDLPARQVYVFQLVGRERLSSAIGLYEVILNASRVVGPAVGGVLLAVAGTAPCFLANALSYVPTLWVLARFRPLPPAIPRPAPQRAARISEGLAEVMRSPEIRSCILIALAGSTVFNLSVAAPVFASRVLHLGGGGYGALLAAFGVGALPGALAAASARGEPSGRRIRALAMLTGAAIVGTAYVPSVAAAFTGMAVVGFLSIWLIAAANTLVQLRSRPLSRGRIMGIWSMALPGAFPVTGLLTALVAAASARAGLAAAGIGMMIVAAATWTSLGGRATQPGRDALTMPQETWPGLGRTAGKR